jgi:hypothetical protein
MLLESSKSGRCFEEVKADLYLAPVKRGSDTVIHDRSSSPVVTLVRLGVVIIDVGVRSARAPIMAGAVISTQA